MAGNRGSGRQGEGKAGQGRGKAWGGSGSRACCGKRASGDQHRLIPKELLEKPVPRESQEDFWIIISCRILASDNRDGKKMQHYLNYRFGNDFAVRTRPEQPSRSSLESYFNFRTLKYRKT